jgi:hypothetical protein
MGICLVLNEEHKMHCELCLHECDDDEIEVVKIYNEYYDEVDMFWACPDCISENENKGKE